MDATVKYDIYLLKGGPSTDDYSSRRLVCSNAVFLESIDRRQWFKKRLGILRFNIEEARLATSLLLPGNTYRLVATENGVEFIYYKTLVSYHVDGDTLELQLL